MNKVHGQFERLVNSRGQVDKLQELVVLTPVIGLASILDIVAVLPPIADGVERHAAAGPALPQIQEHWLSRLGP